MGKETTITCDLCGKDIKNSDYMVLSVSSVKKGQITKQPSIWCCNSCWVKTGLFARNEEEK